MSAEAILSGAETLGGGAAGAQAGAAGRVVLDTNIVLDLFVFDDAAARPLRTALELGAMRWVATAPMRAELQRVLRYPKITPRLADLQLTAECVIENFDRLSWTAPVPPRAPAACRDRDDQIFIDLAVAHRARLVSKDRAILAMKKRLAYFGVMICATIGM